MIYPTPHCACAEFIHDAHPHFPLHQVHGRESVSARELNEVADEALFARIDSAVGATSDAVYSGAPPLATFITLRILWRVRERLKHLVTEKRTCNWELQASLARAVAGSWRLAPDGRQH